MPERKASVLIIGSGGREAALAHAYSKSPEVGKIYVAPGNDLIKYNIDKPVKTYSNIRLDNFQGVYDLCTSRYFDLVDVAQEDQIADGLVDSLRYRGVLANGSVKLAAKLESDKAYARDFMNQYGIPTPMYSIFNNPDTAIRFLKEDFRERWYIKAAGLAKGAGAFPAWDIQTAEKIIKHILPTLPNQAGKTFIIEEFLEGEEFSGFYLGDCKNFIPMGFAQDHKKVNNNDQGPNTGGMGAISHPGFVDKRLRERINEEIIQRTLVGLDDRLDHYPGVLYVGGMYNHEIDDLKVIEFNCRWGDPEVEVLLPGITKDYYELSISVASSDRYTHPLKGIEVKHDGRVRVSVAAAGLGYPDEDITEGRKIYGLGEVLDRQDVIVYGAGVTESDGDFYVKRGRVFHIVAEGDNAAEAREKAYGAMSQVYIKGDRPGSNLLHFRTDIGMKEVQRSAKLTS